MSSLKPYFRASRRSSMLQHCKWSFTINYETRAHIIAFYGHVLCLRKQMKVRVAYRLESCTCTSKLGRRALTALLLA